MTQRHVFGESPGPTVTFWGAAGTVTGSMHLLEAGERRILLDCGLVRGRRDEAHARNLHFPFDPTTLDAVVLTHAHIDHCGNLPNLTRQGYAGPIFCTRGTRDLAAVMLADSARHQEESADSAAILHRHGHRFEPLYRSAHVHRTLEQFVTVEYGMRREIAPGVNARFFDAGHILGSAMVQLAFRHAGRTHRVTFTGDVGRHGLPYLHPAAELPPADLIICESTYGGRLHDSAEVMAERMADVVGRTAQRGGRVIIPAFSLGRTQIVAYYLQHWMRAGRLPRLPIRIDSPLAAEVAKVHALHPEAFAVVAEHEDPPLHYIESRDESDYLADEPGPSIVIASGGMCEGGRILTHLRRHVEDPRSSIILVSYQAPGTVGFELLEKKPTVRFRGRNWNKWAEVVELKGFSGHADHDELVARLLPHAGSKIRLVHGEPAASEALALALTERGCADARPAERGEVASVRAGETLPPP